MSLVYEDALGERQEFFVAAETTAGTMRRPAAGDAMAVLTTDFSPSIARKNRRDSYQGSRDTIERITGKSEYSWSTDGYYVPSGTKNVAPDCGLLIKGLLGNETINANDVTYSQLPGGALTEFATADGGAAVTCTSAAHGLSNGETVTIVGTTNYNGTFIVSAVTTDTFQIVDGWVADDATGTWSLASIRQCLQTVTLVRNFQDWIMETMWGCIPETMTIKASGGDEPKIHFDGRGMGYTPTGYGTLDAAMAADNDLQVQTTEDNMLGIESIVSIGDQIGSNDLGYRVQSGPVAHVFQIVAADDDSAVTITANDDTPYRPHTPTWTDAGVPTNGISGSLTWDTLDMSALITAFELTVKANNTYHDNVAFQQDLSDATPGFFDISGKIDMRLRKDALIKMLDRKDFATKALAVVLGGAAATGTRTEISLGQCEMDFTNFSVPESGVVTVSVPFVGLGSAGNDAITWKAT